MFIDILVLGILIIAFIFLFFSGVGYLLNQKEKDLWGAPIPWVLNFGGSLSLALCLSGLEKKGSISISFLEGVSPDTFLVFFLLFVTFLTTISFLVAKWIDSETLNERR